MTAIICPTLQPADHLQVTLPGVPVLSANDADAAAVVGLTRLVVDEQFSVAAVNARFS